MGPGVRDGGGTGLPGVRLETVGLPRIVATVRTENDASRHVLTKLGFRHDKDGVFYDAKGSLMVLDRPGG